MTKDSGDGEGNGPMPVSHNVYDTSHITCCVTEGH